MIFGSKKQKKDWNDRQGRSGAAPARGGVRFDKRQRRGYAEM